MNPNQNPPGKRPPGASPSRPVPKQNALPISQRGLLSVTALLISLVSLAIAMAGGGAMAYGVLVAPNTDTSASTIEITSDSPTGGDSQTGNENSNFQDIIAKLVALGLAYAIGWLVALFGIRVLGNLMMILSIRIYSWVILVGICVLYIVIIRKLYEQDFEPKSFILYILVMVVGLVALIGLHLLIEGQRMASFSIPILIISMAHLYIIVYHYVFAPNKASFIWYDTIFLLFMGVISSLMLARLGLLSPIRNKIDGIFKVGNSNFEIK